MWARPKAEPTPVQLAEEAMEEDMCASVKLGLGAVSMVGNSVCWTYRNVRVYVHGDHNEAEYRDRALVQIIKGGCWKSSMPFIRLAATIRLRMMGEYRTSPLTLHDMQQALTIDKATHMADMVELGLEAMRMGFSRNDWAEFNTTVSDRWLELQSGWNSLIDNADAVLAEAEAKEQP
jgi:hypothetical protein